MGPEADVAISRRAWLTFVVVSVCGFQVSMSLSIINVAFPSLERSFPEASAAQLSWVINSYTIVAAALLIIAGAWGDRVGRKRVLLLGVAGFLAASIACALSTSVAMLIAARCVQAASSALITPMSAALIAQAFPASRRATAVALWAGVGGLAGAVGPSLGAALVDAGGWQWAFWINVPGTMIGLVWGLLVIEESRDPDGREVPDLVGAAVLMFGVSLTILAIVQSRSWGWSDPRTGVSLVVGLVLIAVLIRRSMRHPTPILELGLFRYRDFTVANIGTASFGVPFFAMFLGYVLFLTNIWGYSTLRAGMAILPLPISVALVAPVAGRIADRHGHRSLMMLGGVLFGAGGLWLRSIVGQTPDLAAWLPGMTLHGLGAGLVWPSIFGATLLSIPEQRYASATGINQTIQRVTTAVGVAVVVVLVGDTNPAGLGNYPWLFVFTGLGGLAALVVGSQLRRGRA